MIQKIETKEFEDEVFALTTDSDYMSLFVEDDITYSRIFKIRRWIRHSEKEKGKFQKKLESDLGFKAKKTEHERIGIGWWILNEFDKSRACLAQAKTGLAHAFYALCLKNEGDIPGALAYLDDLSGDVAQEVPVLLVKARMYFRVGRVEDMAKAVKVLEKKASDDFDALKIRGMYMGESGRAEEALALLEQALEIEPADDEALFQMANLLDRFGLDGEALRYYERAAEVFPVGLSTVLNLGQLYYERGDTEKAAFCFKRVLKAEPTHALALRFMKDVGATDNMYYDEKKAKKAEELNRILLIPVTDFELSVRSRNCLSRMNIRTLGDLIQKTEADLLSYKNFGETSLAEIKKMLASKSLYLGQAKDLQNQELREKQKRKIIDVNNNELLAKSIDDLELSVRAGKCLKKMGVKSFGDLHNLNESVLLKMRNFGQTSLNEIKQKMATYGLSLQSDA